MVGARRGGAGEVGLGRVFKREVLRAEGDSSARHAGR